MVIRELTYQLHKLEALESALVSADHHDKKSVLGIGGKNPDRSIPNFSIMLHLKFFVHSTVLNLGQYLGEFHCLIWISVNYVVIHISYY